MFRKSLENYVDHINDSMVSKAVNLSTDYLPSLESIIKICCTMKNSFCHYSFNCQLSAEKVLSYSNQSNCIQLLKSMPPINKKKNNDLKKAAVLVPLCEIDNQLSLLYTIRAPQLKVNGGQVSFPGGMQDKSDRSLKETALRETYEEIGIPAENINIWGPGPEIYRLKLIITPFLGYVKNININDLNINSNEVSMVFFSTLSHLSNSKNFMTTQFRLGKTHVYSTPVYLTPQKRIWGLTALITHIILSALIPEVYSKNIQFSTKLHKIFRINDLKS